MKIRTINLSRKPLTEYRKWIVNMMWFFFSVSFISSKIQTALVRNFFRTKKIVIKKLPDMKWWKEKIQFVDLYPAFQIFSAFSLRFPAFKTRTLQFFSLSQASISAISTQKFFMQTSSNLEINPRAIHLSTINCFWIQKIRNLTSK